MALTITTGSQGISTTSSASVAATAVTASIDDWIVAIIAADNNGTNGAVSLSSVTDSAGNTYTQRARITYDPGAAAAGVTLGIYTAAITGALSSGSVMANFSPNTKNKTIQLYRVQRGVGDTIQFVAADATGLTGSATSLTANTVSVTNGDTIFGVCAIESDNTITGASDTTNGSWSSIEETAEANGVTDDNSMKSGSQWKTVNATGNQSWAATIGQAMDSARSYLIIRAATVPAALVFNPNPFLPFLVR